MQAFEIFFENVRPKLCARYSQTQLDSALFSTTVLLLSTRTSTTRESSTTSSTSLVAKGPLQKLSTILFECMLFGESIQRWQSDQVTFDHLYL